MLKLFFVLVGHLKMQKDNPEFCNHDSESNKTFPDKMWGSFYFSSKENEGLRNMLALIEKVKKDHPDLDMGFRSPGDFGFIWTILINDVMLVVHFRCFGCHNTDSANRKSIPNVYRNV